MTRNYRISVIGSPNNYTINNNFSNNITRIWLIWKLKIQGSIFVTVKSGPGDVARISIVRGDLVSQENCRLGGGSGIQPIGSLKDSIPQQEGETGGYTTYGINDMCLNQKWSFALNYFKIL